MFYFYLPSPTELFQTRPDFYAYYFITNFQVCWKFEIIIQWIPIYSSLRFFNCRILFHLCYGLMCPTKIRMSKPSSPIWQDLNVGSLEVTRSWGWSPHEWDQCPSKESHEIEVLSLHHVKIQEEICLKTKKRVLIRNQISWSNPNWSWISQPPELQEKNFLLFNPAVPNYFGIRDQFCGR